MLPSSVLPLHTQLDKEILKFVGKLKIANTFRGNVTYKGKYSKTMQMEQVKT